VVVGNESWRSGPPRPLHTNRPFGCLCRRRSQNSQGKQAAHRRAAGRAGWPPRTSPPSSGARGSSLQSSGGPRLSGGLPGRERWRRRDRRRRHQSFSSPEQRRNGVPARYRCAGEKERPSRCSIDRRKSPVTRKPAVTVEGCQRNLHKQLHLLQQPRTAIRIVSQVSRIIMEQVVSCAVLRVEARGAKRGQEGPRGAIRGSV
jgi:hypothetical protein